MNAIGRRGTFALVRKVRSKNIKSLFQFHLKQNQHAILLNCFLNAKCCQVLGFCCSALKAGKATDFIHKILTSMDTPLNVKASFTCEIERKEHFWKVLMNILNIMYFPRPSCSKCNFPSSGNLKIYSIQFQPFCFRRNQG